MENKSYLPHSFLAEKMVLSCLIYDSTTINNIIKSLPVESFYFKNHQEIFKAINSIYQKNKNVNIMTLTSFLQENGLLEKAGGIKVLSDLTNLKSDKSYLQEYIAIIKDKFLRRELIKIAYKAINSSYNTNILLEKTLTELEQQLFNLDKSFHINSTLSITEVLNNIFLELKERTKNPNLPGLRSGFYSLDYLTKGFQKSDLIIVAGRPSIGKTAFSLTLSLNIIKLVNKPILFFSLEMSKEQLIYRLLAMETFINQSKLKNGKLNKEDWIKINKIIRILLKLPFFIDESYNLTVLDIRAKLKKYAFEQKEIGLIIIDYLQLMEVKNNKYENRTQEVSQITRNLKNLAREFNVPIIVLSQLSRNVENRVNKKPILSDLRESGSIEQDADLVLLMMESPENSDKINENESTIDLILAKHRNGPTGTIKLKFNKKISKYSDF